MVTYNDILLLNKLKWLKYTCWFSTKGICSHTRLNGLYIPERLFESWDKHSGDFFYPVPHKTKAPINAFHGTTFKFNPLTQYGRDRYDLLCHLIKELEKELEPK